MRTSTSPPLIMSLRAETVVIRMSSSLPLCLCSRVLTGKGSPYACSESVPAFAGVALPAKMAATTNPTARPQETLREVSRCGS